MEDYLGSLFNVIVFFVVVFTDFVLFTKSVECLWFDRHHGYNILKIHSLHRFVKVAQL